MTEFNKFPKGNPNSTYTTIEFAIHSFRTFSGQPITWQMIKSQWEAYLKSTSDRDTKYIKSMENFVRDKDYECTFDLQNNERINKLLDKYKNLGDGSK